MLKLFLTGDNHIGRKYSGHAQAEALIQDRIDAFDTMVDIANSENCDLFVIAGDLFDKVSGITKKEIQSVLDRLARFREQVILLPGNHDYYDPESRLWQYMEDLLGNYDNILVLKEYRPYPLTVGERNVILYPALCTSLHSAPGENNLGWIKQQKISRDGTLHIGLAHGAVEGETIDNEGKYFLMTRSELESIPMDLWLIGHTHVPFPSGLTETLEPVKDRIFNAGTHVQTDVSCNTEGLCFILQLENNGSVRAKKVVSGRLRFYRRQLHVTAGNLEEELRQSLRDIGDHSVVDLILSGAVTAEEYENRDRMIRSALSRFLEGNYRDQELSRQITAELVDSEFSETSFSGSFLKALLDQPSEAQMVYELLNQLKEGK